MFPSSLREVLKRFSRSGNRGRHSRKGRPRCRLGFDRLEDRLSRESAQAEVKGRAISLWAGICTGAATSEPGYTEASAVLEEAMRALDAAKQDRERRRRMWLTA